MKPKLRFAIQVLILLAGCATDPAGTERGPGGTIAYNISVETEQPGCRIEVNGDYVGKAPTTIKVFGDRDGTFHNFGQPYCEIKAYPPPAIGGVVQIKKFGTGGWFTSDDRIPKTIYFNTGLEPSTPRERIDLNINKQ